jgi:hypothetical protein
MIPERAFIIGSGGSIRKGKWDIPIESLEVWNKIKNEFTISTNWNYRYFTATIQTYVDYRFYHTENADLSLLPLVFGIQDCYYGRLLKKDYSLIHYLHDNIYLLPQRNTKNVEHNLDNPFDRGFPRYLSGIFAQLLAISLGCKEIYLLGMDGCETEGRTHYYQGEENIGVTINEHNVGHTGVGRTQTNKLQTSVYNKSLDEKYKDVKKESDGIQVFNVSLDSTLTFFPKISYDEMYKNIQYSPNKISQDNIRETIIATHKKYYDKI